MDDLTDLEICKRIAEIEGLRTLVFNRIHLIERAPFEACESEIYYNPLTDCALNLKFRDKYRVEIDYDSCRVCSWYAKYNIQTMANISFKDKVDKATEPNYKEVNKAVLLCIIEAHKDQS